nr:MAG TPA: hypothetical protein [Caudoviricetes sp.]
MTKNPHTAPKGRFFCCLKFLKRFAKINSI